MDAGGDFVVAWTSTFPDITSTGSIGADVFARRFEKDLAAPAVVERYVFYNHSTFDGTTGGDPAAADGAIAKNKTPLLPGRTPSFVNVTNYARGVNGLLVDVLGLPQDQALTADDFDFTGTRPESVTVRRGAGAFGADRVTLVWRDFNPQDPSPLPQAVANGWLRVTVKANAHTGLAAPDVFAVGNLIGDTGEGDGANGWRVNAIDLAVIRRDMNTPAFSRTTTDFNRDGRTNALDLTVARRALNRQLAPPAVPSAVSPVAARAGDTSDAGDSDGVRVAAQVLSPPA
jgi:hypothetical protein